MSNEKKPKEANLKKALADFQTANEYIQKTIENLQKSHENFKIVRKNFQEAQSYKINNQVKDQIKPHARNISKYSYNTSIEEKTKELQNYYSTVSIKDESNVETIVFL